MATSISDLTNSTSLDGLLKNVYLPTMQTTAYNDHKFSDMIQQRSDVIPGGGNQIVHFAMTQRSEGVGVFSEGGNWVNNVPVKGKQMSENVKFLNAYFALTGPVIAAANSSEKSAVDIVTKTVQSNIESFKNYFDRMIMGDRSGRLGLISSVTNIASEQVTVTKTGFSCAPYFADMFLPVGARCNIPTVDSEFSTTDGSTVATTNTTFHVTGVVSRDTSAGTAVLSLSQSGDSSVTAALDSSDVAVGDYLIREGAWGTSTGTPAISNCLETNGLMNLVSDGSSNSETTSNYTTIWGLTRTSYNYLQSFMNNFADEELTEDNLTLMLMDLKYSRQARPNLLMVTPKAERQYFLNFAEDKRWPGVTTDYTAGYRTTSITLEDATLRLSSLGAIPTGTLFMLNTNDFAFASNKPLEWVLGDGGNVLVQSHTGDNKFASAVQYMNFVCFDPYRQAKGYSIGE